MNFLSTRLADAMKFAHLAPVVHGSKKAADEKPKDNDTKEDDEEASATAAAKDDKEQDREDGDAKADDPSADDDEDENEKQKSPKGKGKRAKAEDDKEDSENDDDNDDEMRGKSAIARARLREQARCAAIMGSRAAGRNVVLAAQLALATRMTREEAITVLENTPAAASSINEKRAANNPKLGAGGQVSTDSASALAAGWDRAFEKAGAVRRK